MKDFLLLILVIIAFVAAGSAYQVGYLRGQQQQATVTEKAMEQVNKWSKLATDCAAQRLVDGLGLPPEGKK